MHSQHDVRHPQLTCGLIKHIPKSARPACCDLLSEILNSIVNNFTNFSHWCKLFNFTSATLLVPAKQGKPVGVAKLVKERALTALHSHMAAEPLHGKPNGFRPWNDVALAAAVSSKIEDGNIKAAVRLLCSEDKLAEPSNDTLLALQSKHPPKTINGATPPDASSLSVLQVTESQVLQAAKSFPAGSSGGPDGFRPSHLSCLLMCKVAGAKLLTALTGFVNKVLCLGCPPEIRHIFFGGKLIALKKKDGGIRPIVMGYTIRRLISKCANKFAQAKMQNYFEPLQVGVAVSGGCEAAVHATRRFCENLRQDEVLVKLDFSNAFNSLSRDAMLIAVADKIPEIYSFCLAAYCDKSDLVFEGHTLHSFEGVHQGDPLGPLLFCLTMHPLLTSLNSSFRIGYLDDVTIGGVADSVNSDVLSIHTNGPKIGLFLNTNKCERISNGLVDDSLFIHKFKHVNISDAMLLGAPLITGAALDAELTKRCEDVRRASEKLSIISAHDALILLKLSLSTPKLNHVLRSSPCTNHPSLVVIDQLLKECISKVTNSHLSDSQWLQASLSVRAGGLGISSVVQLAPSAFLAASAATLDLQSRILQGTQLLPTYWENNALTAWTLHTSALPLTGLPATKQHLWHKPVVDACFQNLLSNANSPLDKARLLAVSSPHSGDWLNALPISSCGLRLEDEAVRVAVGLRLGCSICQPHTCPCGSLVDSSGVHSLSCKKSSARSVRHHSLNDIIHRSLIRASIPSAKEPTSVSRSDGKRPDGVTLIPWSSGKILAWDVTVTDTLAPSYLHLTASSAGSAAERAANNKIVKYSSLPNDVDFVPIAIETFGPICVEAINFLSSLGKKLHVVTGDIREGSFLFQRLSMAVQRYNALAFRETFSSDIADDDL